MCEVLIVHSNRYRYIHIIYNDIVYVCLNVDIHIYIYIHK